MQVSHGLIYTGLLKLARPNPFGRRPFWARALFRLAVNERLIRAVCLRAPGRGTG